MASFAEQLDAYRRDAFHHVFGWVGPAAVDALQAVATYHEIYSISGDALEIGVFQGKFLLALAAAASPSDVVVALDVFDNQMLNIDKSGQGSGTKAIFMANVARFAPNVDALRVIEGDSMTYRPPAALSLSPQGGYRFISIDGGHTAEHVMNDLGLAAEIVVNGGAVFVDDWMSPHWPGVHEGYIRYMANRNKNLAPVLYCDNKLMMTTISHQPSMIEHIRANFTPVRGQTVADVRSFGFPFLSAA